MPIEFLNQTNWTTYNTNGKTILVEYGINGNDNLLIHQVDFNKGKYLEPIKILREGPEGYNSSTASVLFKNKDSIFVFPAARQSFFLYNSNGKQLDEFTYNSKDYTRYYRGGYYSSPVFINKKAVLTTINDTRYDDPEYFEKVSPIQFYDFESSGFTKHLNYPNFVFEKHTASNYTGATVSQMPRNQLLINYNFSDSIFIFDVRTESMNSFYCGSEFFGKPNLLNKVPDKRREFEYVIKEVNYESSFFHGGKVYRVVSHLENSKFYDYSPYDILQQNARVVSLIELDLATKKLKYYKMPIAKYFVFQDNKLFVGGVSIREEGSETYRRFYEYTLE